jgi:hypothetical protein
MTLTPSPVLRMSSPPQPGQFYPAVLPTASQQGSQAPYWGMARGYHKSTTRRALPSGRSSAFQPSLRPKVSSRWLKLTRSRAPRYRTRSPSAIRVSFGSTQGRSARITTWSSSMCDSTGNARGRIADRQLACRHWSNTSSKSRWNCSSWRWNCPSSRKWAPGPRTAVPKV